MGSALPALSRSSQSVSGEADGTRGRDSPQRGVGVRPAPQARESVPRRMRRRATAIGIGPSSAAQGKMTGPLQLDRCTFILFDTLNGSRSRSIRRVLLETATIDPREPGAMTRSTPYLRPAPVPASVLLTLLALGITAPPGAQAGCSHLVTSRADRQRASMPAVSWLRDLAVAPDPPPVPEGPRPCTGAFCSGQPAAPAVPAGVADARVGSWAWCPAIPGSAATGASFLSLETNDPRPLHRWIAVFRPPRPLPSA